MVVAILICVFLTLFAIFAFYVACKEKQERKEIEKEKAEIEQAKKESEENAKRKEQATIQANETKANARTGNHSDDLNFMANKLHEYANKKR